MKELAIVVVASASWIGWCVGAQWLALREERAEWERVEREWEVITGATVPARAVSR